MADEKKSNAPKKKVEVPKEEPPKEPEKKEEETCPDNHKWSIVLFAASILLLMVSLIQGSSVWYEVHKILKGFFGLPLLTIPFMLGYIAMQLDKDEKPQHVLRRTGNGLLLVGFFCSFLEIMFGGGRLLDHNISSAMQLLYEEGLAWSGGGMISALISMPLLNLAGDIGSKIIITLMLFVSGMFLTKKTLTEFLHMLGVPFQTLWQLLHEEYDEDEELEEYADEEPELTAAQTEADSNREAFAIADSVHENRQNEDFLMDVPLGDEMQAEMSEEDAAMFAALEAGTAAAEEASETDAALAEMMRMAEEVGSGGTAEAENAETELLEAAVLGDPDAEIEEMMRLNAEKPRKKTKEEQRQEAVTEIAVEIAQQAEAEENADDYRMPPIHYLCRGESYGRSPEADKEKEEGRQKLISVLQSFNISAKIDPESISRGPSVTRYEVQPAAGIKVNRITGLADNIALSLAAETVRIEAPIPGKPAIGIEVPNSRRDKVSLREILESKAFREAESKLAFAVGRDIAGNIIIGDIAKMPHMIIAGTTGSGKSVCTNSIIMSILYHAKPTEVKLILIDPKIVEFRVYDGIPHLLIPVVTDPKKAAGALNWAVKEMLERYSTFAENGVRDLGDYNRLCQEREGLEPMPQIVIAIDELADLMMASSKEVEDSVCRLAQMARAAGMHLIISTQRPTADVVTGLIKANIPSRIALYVKEQISSRIILDTGGAEKLLGNGDMLYLPNGQIKPIRVQGCYVSTQEIERVVSFVKKESVSEYDENIIQAVEQITATSNEKEAPAAEPENPLDADAELIEKAIEVVVYAGQASTSNLQRRLKLGYARAARIMDELEEMGIIGPYEGAKPRRVLLSKLEYEERRQRKFDETAAEPASSEEAAPESPDEDEPPFDMM